MIKLTQILFFIISLTGLAQQQDIGLKDSILSILKEHNKEFQIDLSDNIILISKVDLFITQQRISPIRGRQKSDTMKIYLTFELNWTQNKYDSIKLANKEILNPLSIKFLNYMDSINWRGVKTNEQMFYYHRANTVKVYGKMAGLTIDEMSTLKNLVRLPDFLYLNYGIYLDCKPNYSSQKIVEEDIFQDYYLMLEFISKNVFKSESVIIGKTIYE